MDNFCLPVHADFVADGDLWRACGYLRSPSPPSSSSVGRDNSAASLHSPLLDDDGRQSSNARIDAYHNHHQQHQQPQRPLSPMDDISNEPMFSFSARAHSTAYKYETVAYQQQICNLMFFYYSQSHAVPKRLKSVTTILLLTDIAEFIFYLWSNC